MRTLLLAPLLLSSMAAQAEPMLYRAPMDDSAWTSQSDGALCHLSHTIPQFGVAVFSEDGKGTLALSIYSQRDPAANAEAMVVSRAPDWKAPTQLELEGARIHADGALLRFGPYSAQRVLHELEAGQEPVVELHTWWGKDGARIALSPVRFQQGLRAHLACTTQLAGRTHTAPKSAMADPLQMLGYRAEGAALQQLRAASGTQTADAPAVIYFATDSAGLDRDAMDTVRVFADALRANPGWTATVTEGHTDLRGSPAYNRELGRRRAQRVRDYLVQLGIAAERVRITSKGQSEPISTDDDAYAHALNRRVILEIVPGPVASVSGALR